MRATPSSVAFCRIQSIFSPRAMPCASVSAQRRFAIDLAHGADFRGDRAFGQRRERRVVLAAIAIEQDQRMAALQAQHARDMLAGLFRQQHFVAGSQRLVDMNAGNAHDWYLGLDSGDRARDALRSRHRPCKSISSGVITYGGMK